MPPSDALKAEALPDLPGLLWSLVRQVPRGKITTYGRLAAALGSTTAARWVGHELLHHEYHPHDAQCLCHRAVRSTGELGAYVAGGAADKQALIEAEGIAVVNGQVDLPACGFAEFTTDRPLEALAQRQNELLTKLSLKPRTVWPETAGGVDVSYIGQEGVAAYALVEVATGELLWSTTIRRPVTFPYITGFLAFRELPLHRALLEDVRAANRLGDVVLVDGSGILHARHAGIATHLGIVEGLETIGVTKKLLCGRTDATAVWPSGGVELPAGYSPAVRSCEPVVHEGSVIGAAILSSPKSARPIYVSPGNGIDVRSSVEIARALLRGRRLPEPLYWADRLSRDAARA